MMHGQKNIKVYL